MSPSRPLPGKVVVVGGSLGRLFAASVLRHIGWEVDVYERSARELDSRDADALLPPPFRAMVHATDEPFAQGILDLVSERMVHNRAVLLGDAAFIPRPHTAAGTSKAAADALALGEALEGVRDVASLAQALGGWEHTQLQLGRDLYRQGSRTGDDLMFRPAAQRPVG